MFIQIRFNNQGERVVRANGPDTESDLRQVDGFLRILRFPPPIKLTETI